MAELTAMQKYEFLREHFKDRFKKAVNDNGLSEVRIKGLVEFETTLPPEFEIFRAISQEAPARVAVPTGVGRTAVETYADLFDKMMKASERGRLVYAQDVPGQDLCDLKAGRFRVIHHDHALHDHNSADLFTLNYLMLRASNDGRIGLVKTTGDAHMHLAR